MEPMFILGSISSNGRETTMHTKRDALEISFMHPVNFTGSFTTGIVQPVGEVMKLTMPNLSGTSTEPKTDDPAFGKHIREAIAIVKDWTQRP